MLYLALPSVPPPIVITLPPQDVRSEQSTEKTPAVKKPTKPSIENSGLTSVTTAQSLVCISQQPQASDRLGDRLRQVLTKSEGKTVNCISQKKSDIFISQAHLRKQKPAIGFSPVTSASTSVQNSSPTANNLALEEGTTASAPLTTTDKINPVDANSDGQLNNQKFTSALDRFSQKMRWVKFWQPYKNLLIFL